MYTLNLSEDITIFTKVSSLLNFLYEMTKKLLFWEHLLATATISKTKSRAKNAHNSAPTKFIILNDYRTDFWEYLPDKAAIAKTGPRAEILKSLLATRFTVPMTIGLTFENICQPPPPFSRQNLARKFSKVRLLVNSQIFTRWLSWLFLKKNYQPPPPFRRQDHAPIFPRWSPAQTPENQLVNFRAIKMLF